MRAALSTLNLFNQSSFTLSKKIASGLITVVICSAIAILLATEYWMQRYNEEVTQKLNASIAMYIQDEYQLITDEEKGVNVEAFETLALQAMIVNPIAQVYLLDYVGNIIAHSMPEADKELTQKIDLQPIEAFLTPDSSLPIYGEDPLNQNTKKIFSAAKLTDKNDQHIGYLYVVLGGNLYSDLGTMIKQSYSAGMIIISILFISFIAITIGILIFSLTLKRLNKLSQELCQFTHKHGPSDIECDNLTPTQNHGDEIEILSNTFTQMSEKIDRQINLLTESDNQRRELISNVSHDLRTPLASIQGYLETLVIKNNLTEEEKSNYIKQASLSANRLAQLISELFELAKLESPTTRLNTESFSLTELVYDTVQEFALELDQKEIKWQINTHTNILVQADISLMQRVFENLIRNAIAYTPQKGKIAFEFESSEENTNSVKVKIIDSGVGISEADMPYIFERFYANPDRSRKGTESAGIGLAIVKRILDLHQTEISVKSKRNQGTQFEFKLPIAY
ncbi:sensor histidine kinase [Neptuniibacter sp. QD48_55]|uniref:sensor histidine kinase n=1 Tax=Neptuniibacter sp. QD48_55 TaxID=3398212 RepID=UPI0039F576FE